MLQKIGMGLGRRTDCIWLYSFGVWLKSCFEGSDRIEKVLHEKLLIHARGDK
ncbi:MAG: hypothetical protein PHS47_02645 [Methanocellales archaeon]|nr:hypothetical protein [Methanocellales archaeon]MDD4897959.1 hypothetical protein [Methanocellales archaeon]MDD5447101.1 hypothetical protein [Methanocellales archaeon]